MRIRDAISRVKNGINGIKRDERVSNQFVHSILNSTLELLLKQQSKDKRLFSNLSILTVSECEELEEIDVANCSPILVKSCRTLKQSVTTFGIPYYSSYNRPLLYVSSIDDSVDFIPSTPFEFAQTKFAEFKGRKQYYWFENGKLIFPDTEIDYVKIRGYFKADLALKLNGTCRSVLDQEFPVPGWLEKDLFNLVQTELYSFNKRIPKDENTNLNTNIKT